MAKGTLERVKSDPGYYFPDPGGSMTFPVKYQTTEYINEKYYDVEVTAKIPLRRKMAEISIYCMCSSKSK